MAVNYFASSVGAEESVAEIEKVGGKAFAGQGDLSMPLDVDTLVAKTVET